MNSSIIIAQAAYMQVRVNKLIIDKALAAGIEIEYIQDDIICGDATQIDELNTIIRESFKEVYNETPSTL